MGILKTRFETHRKYHIQGCHRSLKCPKNLIRLNTYNSKEHEIKKASVCYEIQKSGQELITEACCNQTGDIVDVVNLDTGEEIEIIHTNGLAKAVNNGRRVIMTEEGSKVYSKLKILNYMGDNFIYQLIYSLNMPKRFSVKRSPRLDTVIMVEKTIDKYGGEFNRTQIWKKLPKKVMWQTYVIIIDYLLHTNRIAVDREGKLCSIWNPKLAKKLARRKEISV